MTAAKGFARHIGEIAAAVLLIASAAGCGTQPSTTVQSATGTNVGTPEAVPPTTETAAAGSAGTQTVTPGPTRTGTPMPTPTSVPLPEAVISGLSKVFANVEFFQAVATVTMDTGAGGTVTATMRQWFKQPGLIKLEMIKPGPGQPAAGSEIIYNGQQITMYDAGANQLTQLQGLPQLMLFLNLPQPQLLPMLQLLQAQRYISELATQSKVVVTGTDSVAGRKCTQVQLTPKLGSTAAGFQEIRVCVDNNQRVPIRIQGMGPSGSVLASIEYAQFDWTTQITEEAFTFRPPTTAKQVTPSPEEVADMAGFQPVTLQEMQSRAGFPLLQPSTLPEGMSLQSVRRATFGDNSMVALFYGTDQQRTMAALVERGSSLRIPGIRLGARLSSNGFEGQLFEGTDVMQVEWLNGDTTLTLLSTLPKAETIDMAGSVK